MSLRGGDVMGAFPWSEAWRGAGGFIVGCVSCVRSGGLDGGWIFCSVGFWHTVYESLYPG